ncbi:MULTISPECIES: citrate lyase holo-[acyl-carrier protein] synthase [unclassified Fusibacter]|uniref:citrate lyase holo-[acyl-carrier protein] synthase n=1 Tax=unclassified Fusibacter TaxID=2624464 RepID=UPI0010138CF5|nr:MULTISPECIES: citrate lyase holo-[acyl-carrier protein] synthase [unclassified Fusibacter]MCK8058598.1 citrate lyase holo-[acyl-carrier protein] synthase [Fusibacter sp. A2]NPE22632.1 citrate lyase holo-[acyl-carrier protein] synthase [Fusibacter sp. A1]RXV60196.1 citrate lyase holo-[acyl-carrier protein] synthase [Fusibacter sp. A1]
MLSEMLEYRDLKYEWISGLSKNTRNTIVVFRINIPGVIKLSDQSKLLFELGIRCFEEVMGENLWEYKVYEPQFDIIEHLAVFEVMADGSSVKKKLMTLEDEHHCGRTFDFDVYHQSSEPLLRTQFNGKQRTCFLCSEDAFACARSKAHSLEALQLYITSKAAWAFDNMKED